MVVVKRQKGDTNDKLLSRFRKKTIIERIVEEIHARARHIKNSEKRKIKKSEKKHRINLQKRKKN